MQESKHARKQTSGERDQASASDTEASIATAQPPFPGTLDSLWLALSARATVTNAFRYTQQDLSWLTDALYELGKRHRVKLTKQDVARLGLNAVLWDYRLHGDASLLGEFAIRRKRPEEA
jgi:hypothetical protein